jgi:hypothetical protein
LVLSPLFFVLESLLESLFLIGISQFREQSTTKNKGLRTKILSDNLRIAFIFSKLEQLLLMIAHNVILSLLDHLVAFGFQSLFLTLYSTRVLLIQNSTCL